MEREGEERESERVEDRVFIPLSIDTSRVEEGFFNTTKLIISALLLGGVVITWVWLADRGARMDAYIKITLIYLGVVQIIIRKFIFEEKRYMKVYKKMIQNKQARASLFWNIISIDNEGIMITSEARVGVIVKAERGTLVGLSEKEYYAEEANVLRELTSAGYEVNKVDKMKMQDSTERLRGLTAFTRVDNKNLKEIMKINIGNMRRKSKQSGYCLLYYIVYADNIEMRDVIGERVKRAVERNSMNMRAKVLKKKQIEEFMSDEYMVDVFSATEEYVKVGESRKEEPFKIIDIEY